MEGQTKSPANPKRKEKKKKEKEEIRMLMTVARIGIETKGKRSKGGKRTLKGGKLGAPLHTDHRRRPRPAKNQSVWEESFSEITRCVSAKREKVFKEVLKAKEAQRN